MAPKTAKSARSGSAVMSAGRFATNTTRRHAGWKDVAEPERWCLDGGAVSVGNRRRSGTQLDEVWKAKPKSTKENTRTTKGSEDGRHKHLRKQNISCQKENKSLETIVFQRKQTFCGNVWNSTKKQTQYPNGGKVYFSGRNQSLPKGFVSSDKTNFAQYTFKQRFPTKQTNKTTEKKVCFGEFQTSSVEVCFKVSV